MRGGDIFAHPPCRMVLDLELFQGESPTFIIGSSTGSFVELKLDFISRTGKTQVDSFPEHCDCLFWGVCKYGRLASLGQGRFRRLSARTQQRVRSKHAMHLLAVSEHLKCCMSKTSFFGKTSNVLASRWRETGTCLASRPCMWLWGHLRDEIDNKIYSCLC